MKADSDIDFNKPEGEGDGALQQRAFNISEHSVDDENLDHERRDERVNIRAQIPFEVEFPDGSRCRGIELSMSGFKLWTENDIQTGVRLNVRILVNSAGIELIVPTGAKCVRSVQAHSADDSVSSHAFEIEQIATPHRELLRRIIRSYLQGTHASVESLIGSDNAQTPRVRDQIQLAEETPPHRVSIYRYLPFFGALALLVAVGSSAIYRNFFLIEPSFAAVTAPRIDIRSPSSGLLRLYQLGAGDKVSRDETLAGVTDVELQTDLVLARASQRYNIRLIDNLKKSLSLPNVNEFTLVNSARPAGSSAITFETASAFVAKERVLQFETAAELEATRVQALQARTATNAVYSPCDCTVAWALGSAGGTWIEQGDPILTLIKTNADDIMVEALVHMNDISRIRPAQIAYIALADASQPIKARVRSVALDIERQPRAGFPNWVRQQQNVASVLLIPESPLPADAVGQPVDVRFVESATLSSISEWLWQGARGGVEVVRRLIGLPMDFEQDSQDKYVMRSAE